MIQELPIYRVAVPETYPDLDHSKVPVGISARHIHLSQRDINSLFGSKYELKKYKKLYQEGQFAAQETLTVVGPKGVIENVRIIGPARKNSQIEISKTDAIILGIKAAVRESGDLEDTPGCVLIGPKDILTLKKGVIVAAAHIHMSPQEADALQVKQGEKIQVSVFGERSVTFNNVLVRIDSQMKLEMHLDTDEANASLLNNGESAFIMPQTLLS